MLGKRGFFEELLKIVFVFTLIVGGFRGIVALASETTTVPIQPTYNEIQPFQVWGQVVRERITHWALGSDTRSHVHAALSTGVSQNVTARAWVVNTSLPVNRQERINQATLTRVGWVDLRNPWTIDILNIMDARGNWE